jgi:hypothetical protein
MIAVVGATPASAASHHGTSPAASYAGRVSPPTTTCNTQSIPSAPSGYASKFSSAFETDGIDSTKWYEFSGEPGSYKPYGWWATNQLSTDSTNGLDIVGTDGDYSTSPPFGSSHWPSGYGEATGGVQAGDGDNGTTDEQVTGGIYEWCMKAASTEDTLTAVLDIGSGSLHQAWPPEIDWYEDAVGGLSDTEYTMTAHYTNGSSNFTEARTVTGQDNDAWNVYKGVWYDDTSNQDDSYLELYENGTEVAYINNNDCELDHHNDDTCVPTTPLSFDAQTQSIAASPTAGTTNIAWIAEFYKT